MATRSTIRAALTVALLVLAGLLGWVAWTKLSEGLGTAALVFVPALLPLAAVGALLFRREGRAPLAALGLTLAIVAALVGALVGVALTICLFCTVRPPMSIEAIALWLVAAVVLALTVFDVIAGSSAQRT